jgi:hypothetical protein
MEIPYTRLIPLSHAGSTRCVCPKRCKNVVEFLSPLDQERVLALCDKKATAYAYAILKTVGILKTTPLEGRTHVDGRTLNKNWSTLEEHDLITFIKTNGIIYGGFRMFAEQHGKTVDAVKEKVRMLRKEGRIPPANTKGEADHA